MDSIQKCSRAFSFTSNEVTVENKKVRGWREDANLYSFNCILSFVEKEDNDPTFFSHRFFTSMMGKEGVCLLLLN